MKRSIRLEHLLLNQNQNLKIIGWRRAISYWSPLRIDSTDKPEVNIVPNREKRARCNNHLPPETFLNNYDPRWIDIWSFGIIVCSLMTFHYPFNVLKKRVLKNIEQTWNQFKRNKLGKQFVNESLESKETLEMENRIDDQSKMDKENLAPEYYLIVKFLDQIFLQDPAKRASVNNLQKCSFFTTIIDSNDNCSMEQQSSKVSDK